MAIERGTRIGIYEIAGLLGIGGMGEVYRARDTRLGRDVAIKVLATRVIQELGRPRIEREARILASLNHPAIATIYGVEDWEGAPAIVMELVEGETLAVKLMRGRLPMPEVIRIAWQVAEALRAAHARGVVHRDLKPANIHVRPDGAVKVLDFGLAFSMGADGVLPAGQSLTGTGSILGTVAYMSPEQARGEKVDQRTDIWSFGCVVFEMLTGVNASHGATPADTIVNLLSAEPNWTLLPESTPPDLRKFLRRALKKDVRERLADLTEINFDFGMGSAIFAPVPGRGRPHPWRWLAIAAAIVVCGGLAWFAIAQWYREDSPVAPLRKFEVEADGLGDELGTYTGDTGPGAGVVISPDGRRIVYPAKGRLWVRELSELNARELDGTEMAVAPVWSPDSNWVAYVVDNQLRKSPITGGRTVSVTSMVGGFVEAGGVGWSADDELYYSNGNGPLWRVSASGGESTKVVDIEAGVQDFHDATVTAGRPLMISHYTNQQHSIDVVEDGVRRVLFGPVSQVFRHAAYSRSGHLVFQRVDTNPGIWAIPVDPSTLAPRGDPFLVASGGLRPSVASDGTLVYVTDEKWGQLRLSFVDRAGAVVSDVGEPRQGIRNPALSPRGDRVVVVGPTGTGNDLWLVDVSTNATTRLTTTGVRGDPDWDPLLDRVVYSCGATGKDGGICAVNAEPSAKPELILPGASMADFAPDGKSLIYVLLDPATRTDTWTAPVDGSMAPRLIYRSPAFEFSPRISPDGRWATYGSGEIGRPEIYVTDFPAAAKRWKVSDGASAHPQWNPKGGELFFIDGGGRLSAVAIGPSGPVGRPQVLFNESSSRIRLTEGYAPAPDGQRFLVIRDLDRGTTRPTITVVQNWFAEFAEAPVAPARR